MAKQKKDGTKRHDSTLAALLKEKPGRGRPRHAIPRQSVYVALSRNQKQTISKLAKETPTGIKRADVPDMAVILLASRLEKLKLAVAGRDRELPEGITDLQGLYYLWDVKLYVDDGEKKWTSIRLSPGWAVEFGRLQGQFNALFGANRSDVFDLALALLQQYVEQDSAEATYSSLDEFQVVLE